MVHSLFVVKRPAQINQPPDVWATVEKYDIPFSQQPEMLYQWIETTYPNEKYLAVECDNAPDQWATAKKHKDGEGGITISDPIKDTEQREQQEALREIICPNGEDPDDPNYFIEGVERLNQAEA